MCLIQSSGLHMNCITLKIIAQSIAAGTQFRIFFFYRRCFKSDCFYCVGGQSTWHGVSKKGWEQGSAASAPGHVPALTSALAAALTWTSDAPRENPTA